MLQVSNPTEINLINFLLKVVSKILWAKVYQLDTAYQLDTPLSKGDLILFAPIRMILG